MTSSAVWTGALLSNERGGDRLEWRTAARARRSFCGTINRECNRQAHPRAGGMRAARIRSHPPLPCILSDWQPSDQNLHPSSSRKNPISGEWRLREPEKPRGKSSLIRPNQSLVFTAYGRGGGGGGGASSSSSSDGVKREAGPVRRWVRLGVWNKNIEKCNKFDFTGVFFFFV